MLPGKRQSSQESPAILKLKPFLQLLILIAAAAVFLIRGPLSTTGAGDLATPFVSAARLLHGQDPYNVLNFRRDWYAAGISNQALLDPAAEHPVYPPSALLVIAPLAALGWQHGASLYLWGCAALYLLAIAALATEIDRNWNSWRRVLFTAFALSLAPMLTGISKGNLTVLALLLAVFSAILAHRGRPIAGGLALGVACAVKPTVGAGFVAYFLLGGMFNLLGATILSSALLTGIALVRLHSISGWRAHYSENVAFFFGPGGATNWHGDTAKRYDLLNLQLPLWELTHRVRVSDILAWSVCTLLGALWAWLTWRLRARTLIWGPLAACSLLSLLPIYQRNYNAGALLLAFLWGFQNLERRSARVVLVLSSLALLPTEGMLRKKAYPHLSWHATHTLVWRALVMPQLTWIILLIVLCLLAAMAAEASGARSAQRLSQTEA